MLSSENNTVLVTTANESTDENNNSSKDEIISDSSVEHSVSTGPATTDFQQDSVEHEQSLSGSIERDISQASQNIDDKNRKPEVLTDESKLSQNQIEARPAKLNPGSDQEVSEFTENQIDSKICLDQNQDNLDSDQEISLLKGESQQFQSEEKDINPDPKDNLKQSVTISETREQDSPYKVIDEVNQEGSVSDKNGDGLTEAGTSNTESKTYQDLDNQDTIANEELYGSESKVKELDTNQDLQNKSEESATHSEPDQEPVVSPKSEEENINSQDTFTGESQQEESAGSSANVNEVSGSKQETISEFLESYNIEGKEQQIEMEEIDKNSDENKSEATHPVNPSMESEDFDAAGTASQNGPNTLSLAEENVGTNADTVDESHENTDLPVTTDLLSDSPSNVQPPTNSGQLDSVDDTKELPERVNGEGSATKPLDENTTTEQSKEDQKGDKDVLGMFQLFDMIH